MVNANPIRRHKRGKDSRNRRLVLETLEARRLLAGLPFGATPADTGEFMLGSVAVTPVLLESTGQIDSSTENWTSQHIQEVLANVGEGVDWWVDLLETKSPLAPLSFTIDTTYAQTPVHTPYEPISRRSNDYYLWTSEFLNTIGFERTGSLETDMRAFNHAQRVKLGTDWAMTIFVVPSLNDSDGQFMAGGSFNRAFSFAGGLFMVVPSTRPASTYAHETGHLFWARDEYAGGGSFYDQRGYYNTQNVNAANNPAAGFEQQPSIMAAGGLLDAAYSTHTSPPSTLAMVGWQDRDGNGIFDVLDVPHQLTGTGYWDSVSGTYKFTGQASVRSLPNQNPSGLGNSITINRIREVEVRFDSGPWQTITAPNASQAELDLSIPLPSHVQQIEIRARDSQTGVVSNVFIGRMNRAAAAAAAGINGSVWIDTNLNGAPDPGEFGQAGWRIELTDAQGNPLQLRTVVEPDNLTTGVLPPGFDPRYTLNSVGTDGDGRIAALTGTGTSTGTRNFHGYSKSLQAFTSLWTSNSRRLQANFSTPTGIVQIDVVAPVEQAVGQLEAYNAAGELLERVTTPALATGQVATLTITRPTVDIAYIIAGGRRNTNVKLDNLQFGPQASTTTAALGTYGFPALPSGTYWVQASSLASNQPLLPHSARQMVAVTAGQVIDEVDFGFGPSASQWHNPSNPVDVNNDGLITPIDALLIINEINLRGARSLVGTDLTFPPFIDTNGDGMLTANDVLQVINYLNSHTSSGREPGGEAESEFAPLRSQPTTLHSQPTGLDSQLTGLHSQSSDEPRQPEAELAGVPPIDRLLAHMDDDEEAWELWFGPV